MVKGLGEEVDEWTEVERQKQNVANKLEASAAKTFNTQQNMVKNLEASAAKLLNTLNLRTERFSCFGEKKDVEMHQLRHKAQKAAAASDQIHEAKLAKVESRYYKQECAQVKETLSLKCDVVQQNYNAKIEVSLLEDDYRTKLSAMTMVYIYICHTQLLIHLSFFSKGWTKTRR